MPILAIAGLALAAGKLVKGIIDKNKASKIAAEYTPYKASPYAEAQLDTARQMVNGRMAGAASEERNIDTSQASYNNFIDKNATSGAQALALAGTGQARANEAYNQLAIKEQQNKYGLLSNLNVAYQNMANEDNKVYQSKLQKYYMDTNQKAALNNSGDANIFGGISDGISIAGSADWSGTQTDDPKTSLRSNQAYKSLDASMPSVMWNNQFAGPASSFNSPSYPSSFQLWSPPMKGN